MFGMHIIQKSLDILKEHESWQNEYQVAFMIVNNAISQNDVLNKDIFESLVEGGIICKDDECNSYYMDFDSDLKDWKAEKLIENIYSEEDLLNLSIESELEKIEQQELAERELAKGNTEYLETLNHHMIVNNIMEENLENHNRYMQSLQQ